MVALKERFGLSSKMKHQRLTILSNPQSTKCSLFLSKVCQLCPGKQCDTEFPIGASIRGRREA